MREFLDDEAAFLAGTVRRAAAAAAGGRRMTRGQRAEMPTRVRELKTEDVARNKLGSFNR